MNYSFKEITKCNMCGNAVDAHQIMGRRLNKSQGILPGKRMGITTTVMKCSRCGLIYSNPQPIPLNIQDHYGVPPESYWTDAYFVMHDDYFAYEIDKIKMLMGDKRGKSLDIGAGIGKAMLAMQKHGFDVYGFEASKPFHEQGLKRLNMDPEKYQLATMESVTYPENTFDFITFGAVLEHLYDPAFCIDKAMKWLRPGGIMHIEVPSTDFLTNKLVNFIYKFTGRGFVSNISPMHTPYHLYEFTLKAFQEHAKQNNSYDIAFYEYYVIYDYTYLPRFLNFIILPLMKYTKTGMQLCVWIKKK